MNISKLAAMAAVSLLAFGSAVADPFPNAAGGVSGVLGRDGVFRVPMVHAPMQQRAGTTIVTGTLAGSITFAVASTLPANAKIQCILSASFTTILQMKVATATVHDGTATCNPQLKYRVQASKNADENFVAFGYFIIATDKDGNGRTLTPPLPSNLVNIFTLPPNGTTTNFTASLRI
jgi:hypothetical protein